MKQGEKTKNLILDESDKLFYMNGYASTSFSDIVEKTGLSKGNITYHFKNKQIILEGIIAKRMVKIKKSFQVWEEQSSKPKERLLLFCDMIVSQKDNLKAFGCPMGTLTAEFSKNEPELYEITLPMFQLYRRWLKEQFILLGLSQEEADEESISLLSRVQGVAMIVHAFKEQEVLEREILKVKAYIDSLVESR